MPRALGAGSFTDWKMDCRFFQSLEKWGQALVYRLRDLPGAGGIRVAPVGEEFRRPGQGGLKVDKGDFPDRGDVPDFRDDFALERDLMHGTEQAKKRGRSAQEDLRL